MLARIHLRPRDIVYWILAALILLPTLLVPRLRPAGLVGCAILAALLSWGMLQRWMQNGDDSASPSQVRGAPTTPAPRRVAIPAQLIDLTDARLTGSGAPFELRGSIHNRAPNLALRTLTVQITRRDCYQGALDPSGCATLWQHRHWMNATVPPLQTRQFAVSIWPHGAVPRARGTAKDEVRVISAIGEAMQAAQENAMNPENQNAK